MTIQFNSLDVIANQETIVELLAFFKRVAPVTGNAASNDKRADRGTHRQKRSGGSAATKEMATQTREGFGSIGSLESLPQGPASLSLMDLNTENE